MLNKEKRKKEENRNMHGISLVSKKRNRSHMKKEKKGDEGKKEERKNVLILYSIVWCIYVLYVEPIKILTFIYSYCLNCSHTLSHLFTLSLVRLLLG